MPIPLFVPITLLALLSGHSTSASPVSPYEGSNPTHTLTPTANPFPTHIFSLPYNALSHSTRTIKMNADSNPTPNHPHLNSHVILQSSGRDLRLTPKPDKHISHPTQTVSSVASVLALSSIPDSSTDENQSQPTLTYARFEARQTTVATRQAPITIYGLYDAIANTRLAGQDAVGPGAGGLDSKKTGLAPIAEVFQAMTRQDPRLKGLPASVSITAMLPSAPLETDPPPELTSMLAPLPSPTFSVAPPEFSTPSLFLTATPTITKASKPNPGIGLVSMNPSVASSLLAPKHSATTLPISSATPGAAPTEIEASNNNPPLPVSKLVILGCVIGGILFFTVCVLILFGGAGLCGFCRHSRGRKGSKAGGKGIAGGLIYTPDDKNKRGSNALAHAMANGIAVGRGLATPNSKIASHYGRSKSNEGKFGGLMSSLFAFRSRNNSQESAPPLGKSPSMTSYFLADKSRPTSRVSRSGRGHPSELEGWTNLTPALLLGPVPVIQAHAQAHMERRDRAREVVRGPGGFVPAQNKAEFSVLEEEREKPASQPDRRNTPDPAKEKAETPQEIALQLLSTMKHSPKSGKKEKSRHNNTGSQDGTAKSKFSVCSSQYSESSLSVIDLYSSSDEDSDEELGRVSRIDEADTSSNAANKSSFSGRAPQLARCASARVLSLPPLSGGGVEWEIPTLEQESLANTLRVGQASGSPEDKSGQGDASPTSRPPRPPRPPTADSPTLSESVYLACSEVAYVFKCAGGGTLNEGEAAGQDQSLLDDKKEGGPDLKVDVSSSSAYSSSSPATPNNSTANISTANPIAPISVPAEKLTTRQEARLNRDGRGNTVNTPTASGNAPMGVQSSGNTSTATGGPSANSRSSKRTSRLLTGLASLTSIATASAVPGASNTASLPKQEKSRSSLLLNESTEPDRSAERLALTRVPGATSASDRFGDAGVSTLSYASYAQGQGYGHDQSRDSHSSPRNGFHQTPTRRPYMQPQTPPHSRSDATLSTQHARRSIQGYDSLLNHNKYAQPHPYTYGPAAGYAYRPSRLSRIEGSPASITASAATGSVTAIGSSAATESSRASPTPSPGLLRSLSNTSESSTSTFDGRHARARSEPSKGPEDSTKAPRVSFNLATLQGLSKQSNSSGNNSGPPSVSQSSESGNRGGSPRSLGKPQKKKRLPSYYHTDNEVDVGAESDIQEAVIRRIMKHRRSRSNSGWAYAGRGRTRR